MDGFRSQLDAINARPTALQDSCGDSRPMKAMPWRFDRSPTSAWPSTCPCGSPSKRFSSSRTGARTPGHFRDRKQWFEPIEGPILGLWWIPAEHVPTVAEALERLRHLKERGPSPDAFTFRKPFPFPDGHAGDVAGLDAELCEWATVRRMA